MKIIEFKEKMHQVNKSYPLDEINLFCDCCY